MGEAYCNLHDKAMCRTPRSCFQALVVRPWVVSEKFCLQSALIGADVRVPSSLLNLHRFVGVHHRYIIIALIACGAIVMTDVAILPTPTRRFIFNGVHTRKYSTPHHFNGQDITTPSLRELFQQLSVLPLALIGLYQEQFEHHQ